MLSAAAPAPAVHPIHTTLTEVVQQGSPGTVTVTIRGFADDLESAARVETPSGPLDSAIVRYLARQVALVDGRGQRLSLRLTGRRQNTEVLWYTFTSPAPAELRGGSVSHRALTELHTDQVNLVRVTIGGKTRTLLFAPGDGAKRIGA